MSPGNLRRRTPKIGEVERHLTQDFDDISDSGDEFSTNLDKMDLSLEGSSKPGKHEDTFASVVESARGLSLAQERSRAVSDGLDKQGTLPLPAKCSSKLKLLIERQISQTGDDDGNKATLSPSPYCSPYGSPCSSPRIKRKPLKETKRASSEQLGDYVQLNQYKLAGVLGQGSYGIVKLAYNREEDKNYAMKILSKKKLQKKAGIFGRRPPPRKGAAGVKKPENPLDKVYREIAILKKIDHPNVVKLVEVVDDPEEDNLFMAFELLEKGEILEMPADKPLAEDAAWTCFRDVLHGLEYLHYQKVIHRDIKPSNLLRADNGEVKIADLGVSDEFDGPDALLTNTAGTPAFTAPESLSQQTNSTPYSGKAADIWSLGVTLYCLVVGKVPFQGENVPAVYDKIKTEHIKVPDNIGLSTELRDLIEQTLIKDPLERITLPEIKSHPWVTGYGVYPMLEEEENCTLIEVTEDDVENSVRSIHNLDTLILVKPHKKMSF